MESSFPWRAPLLAAIASLAFGGCNGGSNSPTEAGVPEASPRDPAMQELLLLEFRDVETGTMWNMRGEAVEGELAGQRLKQIPAYTSYWFAWSSFWQNTRLWNDTETDGRIESAAFRQATSGDLLLLIPPDGIPPLDAPRAGFGAATFLPASAAEYIADDDIVVGVEIAGDARAYPTNILNFHEIVNHTVGGREISLTYCPLTASGLNFVGDTVSFGNSGGLFSSNLLMYDRETQSMWPQMRAGSVAGERRGERLQLLPIFQGTWQAWRHLYPDSSVLTRQTGYGRNYMVDPYEVNGYTTNRDIEFPLVDPSDSRFHPKSWVFGLVGEESTQAYPFPLMEDRQVINDAFEGQELVVVFQRDARLALAFSRQVDGRTLTFELVR